MTGETQARSILPAGSKGRKQWYRDEERLLLELRQQNPKVNWVEMQSIFNRHLQTSRHRTADALACKHKTMKHTRLGEQPQASPSCQAERSHQHSLVDNATENVRTFLCMGCLLLTRNRCSLRMRISLWRVWESFPEIQGLDWTSYWDGTLDTDGYFNQWFEAQEHAAMRARATVAAVGGSSTEDLYLVMRSVSYPSEMVSVI